MTRYIDMLYVNAYHAELAHGGHEEGGWWFETGVPLAAVPYKLLDPISYEISDALPGDEDYEEHPEGPVWDPEKASPRDINAIDDIMRGLKIALADYDDPRGISSVISTGVVRLHVQFEFARPYPHHRPRYE